MATRPNQEAIETFINITGVSEGIALQKLQEHGGNLTEAVDAHFSEGDRNFMTSTHETSTTVPQDDFMDTDDQLDAEIHTHPSPFARNLNPFSLLDPTIGRSIFETHLGSTNQNQAPFVTHAIETREIPIEVRDGNQSTPQAGHIPTIEDVTGTVDVHDPDIHGTIIINDEDDDDTSPANTAHQNEQRHNILVDTSLDSSVRTSAPEFENLPDHNNDIEEEMIRAAIEASKREAEENYRNHQLGRQMDFSELGELASNKRLQEGSSSFQDEDVEEQPLVRNRTRHMPSESTGLARDDEVIEAGTLPSVGQESSNSPQHNENSFHTDEWGGISSEEHDEAVMLEAAMFGGIPEGSYRHAYAPHEFMQGRGFNPRPTYRPPSPSLEAQRLIREQQDDEYLASLQADREKELKAIEEAEAAREEERQRAEESRRKLQEEQELETQLAAKEVSLPPEPSLDDNNAVTLLVRMPDGNRRGRRFRRSDNLQALFNFIDIGRVVKPGSYRLVRPYPRRAFGDGESAATLHELGLTNKQEALFLELI
ncbi:PREDICTED: plant UBX domain-containing protein 8-like isoform X2 [Lupinus angustifolius]|uniref:plant UBX domain-containing protein 8-like isoform X2 n=1 Tax=Lupinus angustifolius TaxID=3871 RepID=UPI00092EB28B|nr:PREDICTED: plant UBX domain-containing protein 8-like isoform X2 [Lupinus angustifolius]